MKSFVIATLAASWLWALALAASPQLHEWAHGEAAHEDHECFATLLLAGGTDTPATQPVFVTAPMAGAERVRIDTGRLVVSIFLVSRCLEHGPPAVR